jgi:hypothetical protein
MATKLSAYAQKVKEWYMAGAWNDEMVERAMVKGKITKRERDAILASKE